MWFSLAPGYLTVPGRGIANPLLCLAVAGFLVITVLILSFCVVLIQPFGGPNGGRRSGFGSIVQSRYFLADRGEGGGGPWTRGVRRVYPP